MKIIEPSVEYLEQEDVIKHVARCARVCYKREKGNDKVLYDNLIRNGHWSMFRHESVYAMIPNHDRELKDLALYYTSCPYINIHVFDGYTYVSTNGQFIMDNKDYPFIKLIQKYKVNKHDFISIEEHRQITLPMLRYTFKVITQISTSRELNRVSPNNIAEQSTRYVYEDGTLCKPHWYDNNLGEKIKNKYLSSCYKSFKEYKELIDIGLNRQDARGILPLDTATVCVYTYSANEWRHILDLRYYGTTGKSHPNAKIIASMIRDKLIELGYEFR